MKIELDIPEHLLKEMKHLDTELHKEYPFFVLTDFESKSLKAFLILLFEHARKAEAYERAKLTGSELRCDTCSHTSSFHSLTGERICTKIDCACMTFISNVS